MLSFRKKKSEFCLASVIYYISKDNIYTKIKMTMFKLYHWDLHHCSLCGIDGKSPCLSICHTLVMILFQGCEGSAANTVLNGLIEVYFCPALDCNLTHCGCAPANSGFL